MQTEVLNLFMNSHITTSAIDLKFSNYLTNFKNEYHYPTKAQKHDCLSSNGNITVTILEVQSSSVV